MIVFRPGLRMMADVRDGGAAGWLIMLLCLEERCVLEASRLSKCFGPRVRRCCTSYYYDDGKSTSFFYVNILEFKDRRFFRVNVCSSIVQYGTISSIYEAHVSRIVHFDVWCCYFPHFSTSTQQSAQDLFK